MGFIELDISVWENTVFNVLNKGILQFNFFSTACLKMILALHKLFTNTVLKNSSIRLFEGVRVLYVRVHTWTGRLTIYAPHGTIGIFSFNRQKVYCRRSWMDQCETLCNVPEVI